MACRRWLGLGLTVTLLASSGCAKSPHPSRDMQVIETANKAEALQAQRTIMDLRVEVQRLQQELGASRAAQARLEGELRETQRRLMEAQQGVESQREELARAREERGWAAETAREQTRTQLLEAALERQAQEIAEIKATMQKTLAQTQAKPVSAGPATVLSTDAAAQIVPLGASVGSPPRTVTVQRGDTLWGLARKHRVKLADLMAINGVTSHLIFPGQVLTLPQ